MNRRGARIVVRYSNMWRDNMQNSRQFLMVLGLAATIPGCVVPPSNSQSASQSGVRGQGSLQTQGAQPEAQVMMDVIKRVDALSEEVRELRDQ